MTHHDQSRGRSASTPRSDRDITMLANRSDWSRQRAAKCPSAVEPPVQVDIIDEVSEKRPQSYRATIEDVEEDDDDEEENEDEDEDEDEDDEEGDDDEDEEEAEGDNIVTPRNRPSTPQKQEIYGLPSKPDQNKEHPMERRQSSNSRSPRRPDALSFLVQDTPEDEATHDSPQQAVSDASAEWSPRSAFSSSSGSGSHRSVADTDATTPDHSVNGDDHHPPKPTSPQADKYGTPEMTRGPARHPHIPPRELQPRITAPGQGHAKHLPRAEKLPMSGYELLSSKLSRTETPRRRRNSRTSEPDDLPAIQPIYRRFEALNHRLLLHLQDELSELEEQLHRLDTADTQNRRMSNCILPASRRAEFMAGGGVAVASDGCVGEDWV